MDSYIRAPGLVLYPYVFVAGPNKHDILSGILVRAETSSPMATVGDTISIPASYIDPLLRDVQVFSTATCCSCILVLNIL